MDKIEPLFAQNFVRVIRKALPHTEAKKVQIFRQAHHPVAEPVEAPDPVEVPHRSLSLSKRPTPPKH